MSWIVAGFAVLGFLIGNLAAFSAHPIVGPLITLILAATGGSVIAFLGMLSAEDRVIAGKMIFSLSLFCLLGTYWGIWASERQILSHHGVSMAIQSAPTEAKPVQQDCCDSTGSKKYLNSATVAPIDRINWQYQSKQITDKQAYDQLYSCVHDGKCGDSTQGHND